MTIPPSPKQICPTCGAFVTESFCSRCGEKLVEQADFAFSTFAADVLKEFTNLDGRVLHSVAAILSQPGLLTIEYFRGRRVAYLKPVQLFVLANVLYFLIQPIIGFNTFTTSLRIHMNSLWTFAKAIVLTSFVLIIVQFYRFVLFFTAYLAT